MSDIKQQADLSNFAELQDKLKQLASDVNFHVDTYELACHRMEKILRDIQTRSGDYSEGEKIASSRVALMASAGLMVVKGIGEQVQEVANGLSAAIASLRD